MLWDHVIPRHVARDAAGRATELTLVAGRLGDLRAPPPPPDSWAAQAASDVTIWTIKMAPGATWTLPATSASSSRTLYFFRGAGLRANGRAIPPSHAVELRADADVPLEAAEGEVEMLLLGARPIAEPVVQYGPFVMNSQDEIRQAFLDYRATRFGGWPWQSDDPVHPREAGRFARHADGRIERPA